MLKFYCLLHKYIYSAAGNLRWNQTQNKSLFIDHIKVIANNFGELQLKMLNLTFKLLREITVFQHR